MGRISGPIAVRVVGCYQPDLPAILGDAVELGHECHHIGHVFDDMSRNNEIEFIVRERIGHDSKVVNHIGSRLWIAVESNRTFVFICSAPYIENFHIVCSIFVVLAHFGHAAIRT